MVKPVLQTAVYLLRTDFLSAPEVFTRCYTRMNAARQEKIRSLRLEEDRRRSLGAGVLLSEALSDYEKRFGILVPDDSIAESESGKPYFRHFPELCFSLSHSGDYVLLVLSGREAGCDIEKFKPYRTKEELCRLLESQERILKRLFPEGNPFRDARHGPAREESAGASYRRFYKEWTEAEAYGKMTGQGLKPGLFTNDLEPHHFLRVSAPKDYAASVCLKGREAEKGVRIHVFGQDFGERI